MGVVLIKNEDQLDTEGGVDNLLLRQQGFELRSEGGKLKDEDRKLLNTILQNLKDERLLMRLLFNLPSNQNYLPSTLSP